MSTEAALTLGFSGIVALSTVVYAILTWSLVAETRRMRRAQSDAKVGIELVENSWSLGLVDLVVRNDGAGPATDVRFQVVESGSGAADSEIVTRLNELTFIANGISYLAPGSDVRTYLGRVVGRTPENIKTHVHLRVRYRSAANEEHEECYPIDLEQFWNRFRAGVPPLETIAEELKAIRQHLSALLASREPSQGAGERQNGRPTSR